MSGASSSSGSGKRGTRKSERGTVVVPRSAFALPRSEGDPHPHLNRSEGDIIRPLPWMQISNEERGRGQQARLCAEQPAIGPPVKRARALIELLRVTPQVAAVRSQRARILGGPADIQQCIPLAPRVGVLALGEHDQRRDARRREPFAVVGDTTLKGRALVFGRQSSVPSTDD